MNQNTISPEDFWNAYFSNNLTNLTRTTTDYQGTIRRDTANSSIPRLFAKREIFSFRIALSAVRSHDYSSDKRFLYIRPQEKVNLLMREISNQNYSFTDPPPYGRKRMSELAGTLGAENPELLTSTATARDLSTMIDSRLSEANASVQCTSFLVWALGETRASEEPRALIDIILKSHYIPSNRNPLHFEIVNAGLHALWKLNAKACVPELAEIFEHLSRQGRTQVATLFGRLLSQRDLLSSDLLKEKFLSFEFWLDFTRRFRNFGPLDWARFDANSLFWEHRLVAARKLFSARDPLLTQLENDEVCLVSQMAEHGKAS